MAVVEGLGGLGRVWGLRVEFRFPFGFRVEFRFPFGFTDQWMFKLSDPQSLHTLTIVNPETPQAPVPKTPSP